MIMLDNRILFHCLNIAVLGANFWWANPIRSWSSGSVIVVVTILLCLNLAMFGFHGWCSAQRRFKKLSHAYLAGIVVAPAIGPALWLSGSFGDVIGHVVRHVRPSMIVSLCVYLIPYVVFRYVGSRRRQGTQTT